MAEVDLEFRAITAALSADRSFRWQIRRAQTAPPVKQAAAIALLVIAIAAALLLAQFELAHATRGLRSMGGG